MGRIVIVKCGSTMPELAARVGDFEDWIVAAMGHRADDTAVWDARSDDPPPTAEGYIITGSHESLMDDAPWMLNALNWLGDVIDRGVPILGICFGHQMIARVLGGTIGENPRGAEVGTTTIRLTEQARRDALFSGLTEDLRVHTAHYQTILQLPPNVTILATNAMDPYHAVRYRDQVWGLQFHPEMRPEIVKAYEVELKNMMPAKVPGTGRLMNTEGLAEGIVPLQRFALLV
ncbi:MAG: glutamine amidotransferase [Chloroflexota bacterium]